MQGRAWAAVRESSRAKGMHVPLQAVGAARPVAAPVHQQASAHRCIPLHIPRRLPHQGRPVSTSCGVTWPPGSAKRPAGGGTSGLPSMSRRCSSDSRPAKMPGPAVVEAQEGGGEGGLLHAGKEARRHDAALAGAQQDPHSR